MIQWDETSPRFAPYNRHNLIQGTLGTLKGFRGGIGIPIEGVTKIVQ